MSLDAKNKERPVVASAGRGGDRDAFVARLQRIVGQWRSADRLARAMGVSPSAFRKWLKGEAEPSRERLIALAQAAGVNVGWLATGQGPEPNFRAPGGAGGEKLGGSLAASEFLVLPKPSDQGAVAAGPVTPAPPDGQESGFIAFGHGWIRRNFRIEPDELLLETAVGESMQPTIRDGDILLVDTTDRRLREFGIYVLRYLDELLVKRVQRKLDGSIILISDNAVYETERIASDNARSVEVVGRVVWSGGKL